MSDETEAPRASVRPARTGGFRRFTALAVTVAMAAALSACGGGGSSGADAAAQQGGGAVPDNSTQGGVTTVDVDCVGFCATDNPQSLTTADVQQVIAQAVHEASTRSQPATIAVTDRVGNVLGIFRMNGAAMTIRVSSSADGSPPVLGGLEDVDIVPDTMAAVAKAITGAYLASEGNAFSTRVASQIVQEHFNPGESDTPSGPLFVVQFSQLPCGDFVQRGVGVGVGPRRSPLGLAADTGGFPLYKGGVPVGGIGVISDGIYSLDKSILGFDQDPDELIAIAATVGFGAPSNRRADVITLIGKTGRYSDASVADLQADPAVAPAFAAINGAAGALVALPGYYDGGNADLTAAGDATRTVLAGTAFGQSASGIRAATPGDFVDENGNDVDAFIFVDGADANRHPPRAGLDTPGGTAANALTDVEVRQLLGSAIGVANAARAQIRQPDGAPAAVTVSVVDSDGNILGMARTRDAPVFGADVSLQKARTAAFYSGTGRVGGQSPADALRALPDPIYISPASDAATATVIALTSPAPTIGDYVLAAQTFLGINRALESDGPPAAFADRSGGNLSRPTYPDGVDGTDPGPFSKPPGEWSIFSVGLQLDLVYNAVIHHVAFVLGLTGGADVGTNCTGNTGFDTAGTLFGSQNPVSGLANGIQIFPGSVPIYRGDTLIGGIGISGDGVDQDDMIGFLGVHRTGLLLGTLNNAPPEIRADRIDIPGKPRLRYINCPQAPFNGSDEDDVLRWNLEAMQPRPSRARQTSASR